MTRSILKDWGIVRSDPQHTTHTAGRGAMIAEQCDLQVGANTATTVSKKSRAVHALENQTDDVLATLTS